jgi:hypothetical protein
MATVNKLQLEQAELEHDLGRAVAGDKLLEQTVRAAYGAARVTAHQRILELSVKGVIPEGRGGRIMEELTSAFIDSLARILP